MSSAEDIPINLFELKEETILDEESLENGELEVVTIDNTSQEQFIADLTVESDGDTDIVDLTSDDVDVKVNEIDVQMNPNRMSNGSIQKERSTNIQNVSKNLNFICYCVLKIVISIVLRHQNKWTIKIHPKHRQWKKSHLAPWTLKLNNQYRPVLSQY